MKANLYVPHFCYHETLSISGNCRACLVEQQNATASGTMSKIIPACYQKIGKENQEHKFSTESKKTLEAREDIMELLLINHPLDCPICDQGGECDLQEHAMLFGSDDGQYTETNKKTVLDQQ